MTAPAATKPGPWQAHAGGGRPHPPSTTVEVMHRDGRRQKGASAFACWTWPETQTPQDIVGWREIPPEMARSPWENMQALAGSGDAVTLVLRPQDRIASSLFAYLTYERLWDAFATPADKLRAANNDPDLAELEIRLADRTLHLLGYDIEALIAWAAVQVRMFSGRERAA